MLVTLKHLGKDLMSAKNLLRKHELIQTEITAHEPFIDNVVAQAAKLVKDGKLCLTIFTVLINKLYSCCGYSNYVVKVHTFCSVLSTMLQHWISLKIQGLNCVILNDVLQLL